MVDRWIVMAISIMRIILFPLSVLEGRVSELLISEIRGRPRGVPDSYGISTKGIFVV